MEPSLLLNWTDERSCSEKTSAASYLFCVFGVCLSALIMCGNLLIIVSVVYFKQLRTPSNFIILSLAVADLLVGAVIVPLTAVLFVRSCWPHRDVLCQARTIFDILLSASSILNLGFIAVDRYYSVFRPLQYRRKMNSSVTTVVIVMIWTASSLIGVGIMVRTLSSGGGASKCVIQKSPGSSGVSAVIIFFLPAVIMFVIYMRILQVARRQARSLHTATAGVKTDYKATKTLSVVMGIFLICWLPFFLCILVNIYSVNKPPPSTLMLLKWLGWSNSMMNPLVYGFFYTWFRTAIRVILSAKFFRQDCSHMNLF